MATRFLQIGSCQKEWAQRETISSFCKLIKKGLMILIRYPLIIKQFGEKKKGEKKNSTKQDQEKRVRELAVPFVYNLKILVN